MNFLKEPNWARDILFLLLFLVFSQAIIHRGIHHHNNAVIDSPDSALHQIDATFLDNTQQLSHQIKEVISALKESQETDGLEERLTQLTQELKTINEHYLKNSPALTILGPIGTAAIVLKEKSLEKKLLQAVDVVGSIIHTLAQEKTNEEISYVMPTSVEKGLQQNELVLEQLISQNINT